MTRLSNDPVIQVIAFEVMTRLVLTRTEPAPGPPSPAFAAWVNTEYALRGGAFLAHGHPTACAEAVLYLIRRP